MADRDTQQSNINKTGQAVFDGVGHGGICIALVLLYDLFCEITGLNGKGGLYV